MMTNDIKRRSSDSSTNRNKMKYNTLRTYGDWLARPAVGTGLAVASGLSFFFLGMILTLVGPAGSRAPQAGKNLFAFTMVLLLTLLLAVATTLSKLAYRRVAGGPRPYWSMALCGVCLLTLVLLLVGGFSI